MSVIYIMYVWLFVEWYMFLIVCDMCESIEADCAVEDLNSFEEETQDDFEQGKWIISLHFCLYPSMHIIMFTFRLFA